MRRRTPPLISVVLVFAACGEPSSGTGPLANPASTSPAVPAITTQAGVGALPPLAMATATGEIVAYHDGQFVADMTGLLTPTNREVVGGRPSGPGKTTVVWRDVVSGELATSATVAGDLAVTAVSSSGAMAALTDAEPGDAKATTEIVVVDRTKGELGRWSLPGNLVPEAFANVSVPEGDGMPIGVFVIEYLPSGAYRVRVIDTATGQLGLPLNLRDKSQVVDEEIHAVSRSAVFDTDRQLLFTLYQGTTDDMPADDSFIHTLGLINGVWCLAVPPELELGEHDGALAVSPVGRLYVASANGMVAGYEIDDITDIEATPVADTVVPLGQAVGTTVAITADEDEVVVSIDGMVLRLDPATLAVRDSFTWDAAIEALALFEEDIVVVGGRRLTRVGPTHDVVSETQLPERLAEIRRLVLLHRGSTD